MKKIIYYLPSIVFNLAETLIIFLIGILLELPSKVIIMILILFAIIRIKLGSAMHYKDWYKCIVWSTLVFLSLFVVAKTGLILSIIMTSFCAYILTGKGNINDMYLWKSPNSKSKYADIEEFVKFNSLDENLLYVEQKLKQQDKLDYLIYKYRFKDNLTFSEMSEKLEIDNPRIVERLDKISFAIRLYCGI